jgi:L-fuculose-phosphate aldolase
MQNLRQQLLSSSQQLASLGLNRGTSGNASIRADNELGQPGFLITPSGLAVEKMTAADMVWMDFAGNASGSQPPSSEWRFHLDILRHKPEVNAVVHTHSMFATTLSTLRRDIPAFHYMIALVGGDSVRCAPYALFGSQTLSDYALVALQARKACLLANHGMIAVGASMEQALNMTQEVETLCEQYLRALQVGEPHILSPQQMLEVQEKFKTYGAWAKAADAKS